MQVKASQDGEQVLVDVYLEADVVLEFVLHPDGAWEFWQTRVGTQGLRDYDSPTLQGRSRLQPSAFLVALDHEIFKWKRAAQERREQGPSS